jgi:hypothetical protein
MTLAPRLSPLLVPLLGAVCLAGVVAAPPAHAKAKKRAAPPPAATAAPDPEPPPTAPPPTDPAPAPPPAEKVVEKKAEEAKRFRLLVMDLGGNDVDAATVSTIQGIVTARLAGYPELDVLSGEDVKRLVELEGERQSFGSCSEASCLAEIADAMGAQLVVFGNVGRLDASVVLNLNLFDSQQARGLGRIVVQVDGLAGLPRQLSPKLHDLLGRFYAERGLVLPPLVEEPGPSVEDADGTPWVLAGVGGALSVAGIVSVVVGVLPLLQYGEAEGRVRAAEKSFDDDRAAALTNAESAQADLRSARDAWNGFGYLAVDVGAAVAGVGLGLVATGIGLGLAQSAPDEATNADGATAPSEAR